MIEEARKAALESVNRSDKLSAITRAVINDHVALAIDAFLSKLGECGYVIVPREPSEAMLESAVRALEFVTPETEYSNPMGVWRAMLAAAEQP